MSLKSLKTVSAWSVIQPLTYVFSGYMLLKTYRMFFFTIYYVWLHFSYIISLLKEFNKPFNSLLIQDNNEKSNYNGTSQKNSIAFDELSEEKFG